MFDFHEKRKIRSLLYSKPAVATLFLVTVLLSISAYNRFEVANDTAEKLESKRTELQKLEERAEVLGSKVKYLQNERGVEEELRNRFNVAREGEKVIILVDPVNTTDSGTSTKGDKVMPDTAQKHSFLSRFKFW